MKHINKKARISEVDAVANNNTDDITPSNNTPTTEITTELELIEKGVTGKYAKILLARVLECMKTGNQAQTYEYMKQFTAIFTEVNATSIDEVVQGGSIPILLEFLRHEDTQIRFSAAWTLTNIAAGSSEHTKAVIEHGAIPVLVEVMQSGNMDFREQVVWAIGNIAGDSPNARDLVLQHNALGAVLKIFDLDYKTSLYRNATWALANFFRGNPSPPYDMVIPALPALTRLLRLADEEVVLETCRAMMYIYKASANASQVILDLGILDRLMELLDFTNATVQEIAIHLIGKITIGNDQQTQAVVDAGILNCLKKLIWGANTSLCTASLWVVSNITAGSRAQIQAVIDAGYIPLLIQFLGNDHKGVRTECVWAIVNALAGASEDQITFISNSKCVGPLCNSIEGFMGDIAYVRTLSKLLEGLEIMCGFAESQNHTHEVNRFKICFEEVAGVEKVISLWEDDNEDVAFWARRIIWHFVTDDHA